MTAIPTEVSALHSTDNRHSQSDALIGLNNPISRRDFLNGVLLTGAGLLLHGKAPTISPEDAFNGYGGIGDYAHSNGNTWDVLTAGHAMRDGAFEKRIANAIDTGEIYDLVAVGGGISRTRRRGLLPEIQRRTRARHRQPPDLRRRSEAQRIPRRRTSTRRAPGLGHLPRAEEGRIHRVSSTT